MISSPPSQFVEHLENYSTKIEEKKNIEKVSIGSEKIPAITLNRNRLFAFCSLESPASTEELTEFVSENEPDLFKDDSLFEITVAVSGLEDSFKGKEIFGRGKKISTTDDTIAELIGMADGWKSTQRSYLEQTLEPLRLSGEIRLADLYLRINGDRHVALEWLEDRLSWCNDENPTLYLRAEAGKGKSTLLAETARRLRDNSGGPLPLYIPLRNLRRETGISWAGISGCVGVMGKAAENLRLAVQSGLVIPLLDGLDEVAGRYDPTTVQEVEKIILEDLHGLYSRIVMSGRTTEATHLNSNYVKGVGIEIPDSSDESFEEYTKIVINNTTPEWPNISTSLDDLYVKDERPDEEKISNKQKKRNTRLGKRSL